MTKFTTSSNCAQSKAHLPHYTAKDVWLDDAAPQPKKQHIGHDVYTTYAKGQAVDLSIPDGHRALIITPTDDGGHLTKTVSCGDSVLNVRTELTAHLEDLHLSDNWLLDLRAWIDHKLEARERVRDYRAALKAKQEVQNV